MSTATSEQSLLADVISAKLKEDGLFGVKVEVDTTAPETRVVLTGTVDSFYLKSVAQNIALETASDMEEIISLISKVMVD